MTTRSARSHRPSFAGSRDVLRTTFRFAGAFATCSVLVACAAANDEDADGPPDFNAMAPGSGGMPSTNNPTPSSPATGSSPSAGTTNASGSAGQAPTEGQTSVNTPVVGAGGAPGNGPSSSAGTGNVGAAGAVNAGGSAPVAPNGGAGGSAPSMNTGGAPAGGAPDIPCPEDASFCSGFEGTTLPEGTNFVIGGDASFANQFALDASQAHSGQQSFMVPGPSPGFSYRALAVPAPSQDFWARLYVRVASPFGDGNHDSLFGASNADLVSDHNNETLIELSEQFGYVLLNTDDCTLACNTPAPQLQLAADTWHCLEAHYDGNTGHVEVFLEGSRFIDATRPEHQLTFQTFRLGYMRFNTERSIWYDDVVLAASRVGCE